MAPKTSVKKNTAAASPRFGKDILESVKKDEKHIGKVINHAGIDLKHLDARYSGRVAMSRYFKVVCDEHNEPVVIYGRPWKMQQGFKNGAVVKNVSFLNGNEICVRRYAAEKLADNCYRTKRDDNGAPIPSKDIKTFSALLTIIAMHDRDWFNGNIRNGYEYKVSDDFELSMDMSTDIVAGAYLTKFSKPELRPLPAKKEAGFELDLAAVLKAGQKQQ